MNLLNEMIKKTLTVPHVEGRSGAGAAYTRQLDGVLMSIGFKLSADLFQHFAGKHPNVLEPIFDNLLAVVREIVGDHVRHNVYFKQFPKNVPDTETFWMECLIDALGRGGDDAKRVMEQVAVGRINLLDLPKYGKYQHTYEEMIVEHQAFVERMSDRMTVLHLGNTVRDEQVKLYDKLAATQTPLNEGDRTLLSALAAVCVGEKQPDVIPLRENRALINAERIQHDFDAPLLVDTVTDVLRLAAHLSKGDVTLEKRTKFASFPRGWRRAMMEALNSVDVNKFSDVLRHTEMWKRLGERLKPHEYKDLVRAQTVFSIARAKPPIVSTNGTIEKLFREGKNAHVLHYLAKVPGVMMRSLNRLLLNGATAKQIREAGSLDKVSTRVLLSVRQYLTNRETAARRIFVNRKGKAWTEAATQETLSGRDIKDLNRWIDDEMVKRVKPVPAIYFDLAMTHIALPLSNKSLDDGFGMLPRGSVSTFSAPVLRFFAYWKEKSQRTDYDLSTLFLEKDFTTAGHVSWTSLRYDNGGDHVHSGDITSAPNGASEFIDIKLDTFNKAFIVPQLNVFAGENFANVEECFFGFMGQEKKQKGAPFEPRSVRMKSSIRGNGQIALPLVFMCGKDGTWTAKWIHLYLTGRVNCNRIENNRVTTSLLVKTIVERQYLTVHYLLDRYIEAGVSVNVSPSRELPEDAKGYYLGFEKPNSAPKEVQTITANDILSLLNA